jgi:hypothetical protein
MSRSSPVKRGRPRKEPHSSEISNLLDEIERLQIQISNYKHREIGWQAVVSYLEDKIGNP